MIGFNKWTVCGNDFVVVRTRERKDRTQFSPDLIRKICERKEGVGADGLITYQYEDADIEMQYFNSDGSHAVMCGNGACSVIADTQSEQTNSAMSGTLLSSNQTYRYRTSKDSVSVQFGPLSPPNKVRHYLDLGANLDGTFFLAIVGVRHCVVSTSALESIDVVDLGRRINQYLEANYGARYNVQFVQSLSENELLLRSFEIGIEDETLACGSGGIAALLTLSLDLDTQSELSRSVRNIRQKGTSNVSWDGTSATLSTWPSLVFSGTLPKLSEREFV